MLAGALPARAAYIVALEGVRPRAAAGARGLGLTGVQVDAVAHGCAGLAAAAASMLIYVPVDVVSSGATAAHVQKAAKVPAAPLSAMSGVSQSDGVLPSAARAEP